MKEAAINDTVLTGHLRAVAPDVLVPFLLEEGTLRGAFVNGTAMVNQMRANHGLGILETLVLGHSFLAMGLLSGMLKGGDRYGMKIECGGPIKGLAVETDSRGNVRGRLFENPIAVEAPLENFDLSPFFGPGFLTVTRTVADNSAPFSGQIMIEYGNIAQDLALYFHQSEQTPTAFSLSIQFDSLGRAVGAGGLFLQVMPGAADTAAAAVEDRILALPSLGRMLSHTGEEPRPEEAPERFLREQFSPFGIRILDKKPVRFYCGCSKERFSSFLASLGAGERERILTEGPFPLETTCHNCGTAYTFQREEVESLFSN